MASRAKNEKSYSGNKKASGRLMRGEAPPVGLQNAQLARQNLLLKISIFKAEVKRVLEPKSYNGGGHVIPISDLPSSQRSFNAWESSTLPSNIVDTYGAFHKNGNGTLVKNEDVHKTLLDYFKILSQARNSTPTRKKEESVAGFQRRLALERTLRNIAEVELTRARARAWRSLQEQEVLRTQLRSTEEKAADLIKQLEAKLIAVTAERAELTGVLKKITGIRDAAK